MIFAAIAIEMGMIGAVAVVFAFILLVGAGLRVAQAARSDFSRLMATGLTIIMGFQAFFIMAGVLRLLPFTGITLPFVAYGGSSLLANYALIALLMRLSDEGAQSLAAGVASGLLQPDGRPMVPADCTRRSPRFDPPRGIDDDRRVDNRSGLLRQDVVSVLQETLIDQYRRRDGHPQRQDQPV
jgi:hypothetical protein